MSSNLPGSSVTRPRPEEKMSEAQKQDHLNWAKTVRELRSARGSHLGAHTVPSFKVPHAPVTAGSHLPTAGTKAAVGGAAISGRASE